MNKKEMGHHFNGLSFPELNDDYHHIVAENIIDMKSVLRADERVRAKLFSFSSVCISITIYKYVCVYIYSQESVRNGLKMVKEGSSKKEKYLYNGIGTVYKNGLQYISINGIRSKCFSSFFFCVYIHFLPFSQFFLFSVCPIPFFCCCLNLNMSPSLNIL